METNTNFYYHHADLSYDFDDEHQDHELADIEYTLIGDHVAGASNSLHLFCGAGRHVLVFSKKDNHSVGIDISSYLIQKAQRLLQEKNCIKGTVLCGDVLRLPFQEKTFGCVTALGNSACLLNNGQLDQMFSQAERVLAGNGLFILDMPNFTSLLGKQEFTFDSCSQTKEFISEKFGPGQFTWDRVYDPDKKVIVSNEQIVFHPGLKNQAIYNTQFSINTIYPDEIESRANDHHFSLMDTIYYDDPRNRYKGMLKKRVFMVFQGLQ